MNKCKTVNDFKLVGLIFHNLVSNFFDEILKISNVEKIEGILHLSSFSGSSNTCPIFLHKRSYFRISFH